MSRFRGGIAGMLLVLNLAIFVPSGSAEIYRYVDKDGQVNITDNAQMIPREYRAAAKPAGGETEASGTSVTPPAGGSNLGVGSTPREAAAVQDEPLLDKITQKAKGYNERTGQASIENRAIISLIVVVSAVCILIILRKIDTDKKKVFMVTRVVIAGCVAIYLVIAHVGDVIGIFKTVNGTIEEAQRKSEEKGKKAAKAMKAMDKLLEDVQRNMAEADNAEKKE